MSQIIKIIDQRKNGQKAKTERNNGMAQAIVKVWEVNDFVKRLN